MNKKLHTNNNKYLMTRGIIIKMNMAKWIGAFRRPFCFIPHRGKGRIMKAFGREWEDRPTL